jgi:hypothetical protein
VKAKVVLELFLDSHGTVHMEFIPEGATVKEHRYREILHRLCNSIRRELCCRKKWLLLHDSVPAHCSVLAKQQVTVLPHPPHLLDLAPHDFYFFPYMKEKLCGCQFRSSKEIVTATREAVQDLSANILQQRFQQLYQCWQTCIAASGQQRLFRGRMCMCVSVCIL